MNSRYHRRHRRNAYLCLLPALLFVAFAELIPIIYTTYLGFHSWDIITAPEWAGLRNYAQFFSNPELLNAMKNTFFWVIGTLLFPVGLALLMAKFMTRARYRGIFKPFFPFFCPPFLRPSLPLSGGGSSQSAGCNYVLSGVLRVVRLCLADKRRYQHLHYDRGLDLAIFRA